MLGRVLCQGAMGGLVGSWAGAVVLPLDWGRPWQVGASERRREGQFWLDVRLQPHLHDGLKHEEVSSCEPFHCPHSPCAFSFLLLMDV